MALDASCQIPFQKWLYQFAFLRFIFNNSFNYTGIDKLVDKCLLSMVALNKENSYLSCSELGHLTTLMYCLIKTKEITKTSFWIAKNSCHKSFRLMQTQ